MVVLGWCPQSPVLSPCPHTAFLVCALVNPLLKLPQGKEEKGARFLQNQISLRVGTVPKRAKEEGLAAQRDPFVFLPDFHKMQILNKLFIVWGGGSWGPGGGGGGLSRERPPAPSPQPGPWVLLLCAQVLSGQRKRLAERRLRGRVRPASFLPRGRPVTPPSASGPV